MRRLRKRKSPHGKDGPVIEPKNPSRDSDEQRERKDRARNWGGEKLLSPRQPQVGGGVRRSVTGGEGERREESY